MEVADLFSIFAKFITIKQKYMKRLFTSIAIAMAAILTLATPAELEARSYNIVPEPAYVDIEEEGTYTVTAKTRIVVQDDIWNPAELFAKDMQAYFGTKRPMHTGKHGKGIKIRLDRFVPAEGYEMTINEDGIVIIASDYRHKQR